MKPRTLHTISLWVYVPDITPEPLAWEPCSEVPWTSEGAIFLHSLPKFTLKEQWVSLGALLCALELLAICFSLGEALMSRGALFVLSVLPDQCLGVCHLVVLSFTLLLGCQHTSGGGGGSIPFSLPSGAGLCCSGDVECSLR